MAKWSQYALHPAVSTHRERKHGETYSQTDDANNREPKSLGKVQKSDTRQHQCEGSSQVRQQCPFVCQNRSIQGQLVAQDELLFAKSGIGIRMIAL